MRLRPAAIVLALFVVFTSTAHAFEEFSTRGTVTYTSNWGWDGAKWTTSKPTLPLPASLKPPNCPPSIVIYIHGFQNDAAGATMNFGQAETVLRQAGYPGPVYGFSWDSNPGALKFDQARESANLNGKVLAQLLKDIKNSCPQTKINVITHSLGARVALSALKCGGCTHSTHLIAPAVDNEVLEKGEEFGSSTVGTNSGILVVWHNDEDDILGGTYPGEEFDSALGSAGSEHGAGCLPPNVFQSDATPKLKAGALLGAFSPNPNRGGISQDPEDDHSGYIWNLAFMKCVRKWLK